MWRGNDWSRWIKLRLVAFSVFLCLKRKRSIKREAESNNILYAAIRVNALHTVNLHSSISWISSQGKIFEILRQQANSTFDRSLGSRHKLFSQNGRVCGKIKYFLVIFSVLSNIDYKSCTDWVGLFWHSLLKFTEPSRWKPRTQVIEKIRHLDS